MTGRVITLRDIVGFVADIIDVLWIAATLIVIGFIIWGGVQMVMAGGDENKYKAGKTTLIRAIIGGVVVFGVGIIVNTLAAIGENPERILR